MKKYFMSLIVFASAVSAVAGETEVCSTFDVPALVPIGNAPAEKIHMLVASNDVGQTRLTLLVSRKGLGLAMYTSECAQSRGDISCTKPEAGKGSVQILKVQNTINLSKVQLAWEKNPNMTKIIGSHANLKVTSIDCQEFKDLIN